ncbi:MAG: Na+/H+ antiporter NhaC family protein, partial [Anaerotignaceae bacterium]
MEAINVGILSLFPTIIAITLALLTKEVISSLIIGIFVGTFIYSAYTTTGILNILIGTLESAATLMGNGLSGSIYLIIFIALLGSLVVIITKAGGSRAYGEWASKKITSAKGASLATIILGVLIFIDDYFNCITVGTVMRPVTDKYKIAHVKLAYIIDATAAPICIIAPVSSWAASIISQIEQNGLNGMEIFVRAVPFNLYAILTLVMVVAISITRADFSSMAKHEKVALETGNLDYNRSSVSEATKDHLNDLDISSKGTVFDLIIPISVLILFSILSMLYTGGYFNGGMTV